MSYEDLLNSWFEKKVQLENKNRNSDCNCTKNFYPRQVYWANFGTNVGNEIRKVRPVLILSNLKYNHGKTLVVAPLSTTNHKYSLYYKLYKYNYPNTGLEKNSVVKIDQIRTISISRLCKNSIGETCDLDNIKPIFFINDTDWYGIRKKAKLLFGDLFKE